MRCWEKLKAYGGMPVLPGENHKMKRWARIEWAIGTGGVVRLERAVAGRPGLQATLTWEADRRVFGTVRTAMVDAVDALEREMAERGLGPAPTDLPGDRT